MQAMQDNCLIHGHSVSLSWRDYHVNTQYKELIYFFVIYRFNNIIMFKRYA